MNTEQLIEQEAEDFAGIDALKFFSSSVTNTFIVAAKSNAAKQYWYELFKKEQGDGWISVKDRLPDFDEKVFVFGEALGMNPSMGGAYTMVSWRQDLSKTLLKNQKHKYQDENNFRQMSYVTHWMPLPEKPQL